MATICWVINEMTSTRYPTLFKRVLVEADVDARTRMVMVEDVFELKVEPIKNPGSGEPHRVRIDIPNGFEFTMAEMASGTTKTQRIINLPTNNHSYSHLTELHWNNSSLIRS